jgi:hypothetical protein
MPKANAISLSVLAVGAKKRGKRSRISGTLWRRPGIIAPARPPLAGAMI